jgi:hypothetical protein
MDNTLEQLAQYIQQELQRGQSEQIVRDSLVQHGWTQKAIDGAFGIMQYYQSHPSLPQPMGSGIPAPQMTVEEPVAPARPTAQQVPAQPSPLPNAQNPMDAITTPYTAPKTAKRTGGGKTKALLVALVVFVVLGLVATGVWLVLSGKKDTPSTKPLHTTQTKPVDKDAERKADINVILANLSDYFIAHQTYPTQTQMNDADFAQQNKLTVAAYKDPNWTAKNATCTTDGKAILSVNPAKDCYAYAVSTVDGKPCDGGAMPCTYVKVTVFTNDGKPYSVALTQNALSTIGQ